MPGCLRLLDQLSSLSEVSQLPSVIVFMANLSTQLLTQRRSIAVDTSWRRLGARHSNERTPSHSPWEFQSYQKKQNWPQLEQFIATLPGGARSDHWICNCVESTACPISSTKSAVLAEAPSFVLSFRMVSSLRCQTRSFGEQTHIHTHVSIYIHIIYSLFIYTSYLYVVYIYAHHTNYSLHINIKMYIYIFLHHGVYVYTIYIHISNLLLINHVSILITIMTIILCFFKSLSPLRLYYYYC